MSDADDIELDYGFLTQNALRGVMREVLQITSDLGDVPGEHHFYIEFLTGAPGVNISAALRETYPERMTIVLQHKFEDLSVEDDHFEVTLHFNGMPDHLVIPFDAVTSFVDPSVKFGLNFEPGPMTDGAEPAPEEAAEDTGTQQPDDATAGDGAKKEDGGAEVVSLDAFRKK